jgi:hypothetical protein
MPMEVNGTINLPFMFNGVGRWWGTDPNTKSQNEIDIIADADEKAIFGECKWSKDKIGIGVLNDLRQKSMILKRYTERSYILFSKSGFHKEVSSSISATDSINLVDLKKLYNF